MMINFQHSHTSFRSYEVKKYGRKRLLVFQEGCQIEVVKTRENDESKKDYVEILLY